MTSRFDCHPEFTGELLDAASRSKVRRMLERYMEGPWSKWWVGVSNVKRGPLVQEAMDILIDFWDARGDADGACFSPDAVAEEIDFYLPKIFWKVKRKLRHSGGKAVVNPDWATFEKWHFAYPETRARLRDEFQDRSRFKEAARARSKGGDDGRSA